jgi:DNA polymerase III delta subunit
MVPSGLTGELASAFPKDGSIMKMEDWKRNKLFTQARNFSLNELMQCFERITAVDLAIKGIDGAIGDPARGLEVLIIELSSRQQNNKGRV